MRTLLVASVCAAAFALIGAACHAESVSDGNRANETGAVPDSLRPLRDPSRTGALADLTLTEASGIAPSGRTAGVFWSHNDSGHEADVFALDSTGAALGRVRVRGATNRDWEAIASGPCSAGSCLYIGEVGDNSARYPSVTIWRVSEPDPSATQSALAEGLSFTYPDGPRDVEAMWVAPDTSVWLATKRPIAASDGQPRPALVYRLAAAAWHTGGAVEAELVDSLPLVPAASRFGEWVTDAALSPLRPDGTRRLAIRTYVEVLVFAADASTGARGALLARCSLLPLRERQGEGLAWLPSGRLLFVSEGRGAPLQAAECT